MLHEELVFPGKDAKNPRRFVVFKRSIDGHSIGYSYEEGSMELVVEPRPEVIVELVINEDASSVETLVGEGLGIKHALELTVYAISTYYFVRTLHFYIIF